MSTEQEKRDVCSAKKRRTQNTHREWPEAIGLSDAALTSSTNSTLTASGADDKQTTPPCLHVCQKDSSIIAQILAGTDADFETTLCPPGVLFEDSYFSTMSMASETSNTFSSHDNWASDQLHTLTCSGPHNAALVTSADVAKVTYSLLVCTESGNCSLRQRIEELATDHELITCSPTEALRTCNERLFQLIWLRLPNPPSEELLGVISGIRYSSKFNQKTAQLAVTATQPEIDLNLHGIDDLILEPVSKATIRQKYLDWTSVKLLSAEFELDLKDDPSLSPTTPITPDSSVSTESAIAISLSSLTSDADSGVQAEVDVVDLKPSPPFLFPIQQRPPETTQTAKDSNPGPMNGSPPDVLPIWCRAEHATKEKHRRERIKDSCDQLRVLLPYVRGRKTDMASILEMTVDYLKIVNSKLPQEFHTHVLDIMTKGNNSSSHVRNDRAQRSSARGSRRGRGSRRTVSPDRYPSAAEDPSDKATEADFLYSTKHGQTLSRSSQSKPVCPANPRGTAGESRSTKVTKRDSIVMSPDSQGGSSLYLASEMDKGVQREESEVTNSMQLPTYIPPTHRASPHLFSDAPMTSSHPYSLASSSGSSLSTSLSSDCGFPLPRLFASAHLTVEPGFLSHGSIGNSAPLATPITAHYSLGSERDSSVGLSASFGESSTPTFYHYFSTVPDIGPAYTVAGGGGSGDGPPMCTDFISSGSLLSLSANSAFTPRLQVTPSRGVREVNTKSTMSVDRNGTFGVTNNPPKTTK